MSIYFLENHIPRLKIEMNFDKEMRFVKTCGWKDSEIKKSMLASFRKIPS